MPGKLRPANHTALAALPVVVLDLETTGLNVASDRVIQIGAVAMLGAQLVKADGQTGDIVESLAHEPVR